jgi:hypothetical protein
MEGGTWAEMGWPGIGDGGWGWRWGQAEAGRGGRPVWSVRAVESDTSFTGDGGRGLRRGHGWRPSVVAGWSDTSERWRAAQAQRQRAAHLAGSPNTEPGGWAGERLGRWPALEHGRAAAKRLGEEVGREEHRQAALRSGRVIRGALWVTARSGREEHARRGKPSLSDEWRTSGQEEHGPG